MGSRPYRDNVIHRNFTRDDGAEVSLPNLQPLGFARDQVRLEIVPDQCARAAAPVRIAMPNDRGDGVARNSNLVHRAGDRAPEIVGLEQQQSATDPA